jgi:NTE family protein
MSTAKNTAFVLSGGASLGAIQAGMLRALYAREIAPDLIVGTSVGALNGAFIASRPQTVATAEELATVWRGLNRGKVFPLRPLTGLLGFAGLRDHLVGPGGLRRLLRDHLQIERLEDAAIPLHMIATDVLTGEERRLSSGDSDPAIRASTAIPGVFPSVELGGETLIDGGVANNTPISHALELGAERVYVLSTGDRCELAQPPRGALEMLLHATELLVTRRLVLEIELLGEDNDLIVMPPPCPNEVQAADFSRAEELIQRAYRDGAEFLESAPSGKAQVPFSMSMRRRRNRRHHGDRVSAGASRRPEPHP